MKLIRYSPHLFLVLIIATLFFSHAVWGNPALSDSEKKDAVYRMYAGYKKEFPAVGDIAPRQAREQFDRGKVVFVDTRKPEEMAVSMLPGAISQAEFLKNRDRFADQAIVVYCTISYRSGLFARDMAAQGIPVVNLQGGILAWILEGGPVYDPRGHPTRRVHVFGDRWDYAPAGWESVKFSLLQQIF